MVLFSNISVGQKVQVFYKEETHSGIVKYKGGLANIKGDWVGVELGTPAGKHNGIYKGRQYFSCKPNHGVFLHPSSIRFDYLKRWHFDTYRSVSPASFVDETLFSATKSKSPEPRDPKIVPESYSDLAEDGFTDLSASWHAGMKYKSQSKSLSLCSASPTYSRSHSIGRTLKQPDSQERPRSAMGTETFHSRNGATLRSSTFRLRRSLDLDPTESVSRSFSPEIGSNTRFRKYAGDRPDIQFASSPSMPKVHMPYGALCTQNKKGWSVTHKPREWTL